MAAISDVVSAIREGDVLKMIKLLDANPQSASEIDTNTGLSPLHEAVDYENVQCVEYLLKNKLVDVNQKTTDGRTSLHLAASCSQNPVELCQLLLLHGAVTHV